MVVFGFLFYIKGVLEKISLENKADDIISSLLQTKVVKNYVESCLEKATNEALLLIGEQGGVLYDYQVKGGSIVGPNNFDYGRFVLPYDNNKYIANVSYGIKRSQDDSLNYFWNEKYPYEDEFVEYPPKENYFGNYYKNGGEKHLSFLTPLCDEYGLNKVLESDKSCETYGSVTLGGKILNIQTYLEKYINVTVNDCVDIDMIGNVLGYTLILEKPKVIVLIGDDDLNINLIYPVNISIEGEEPITKIVNYNINPQIRLKKIHELASHLIGYKDEIRNVLPAGEVTNIFFDIENEDDIKNLNCGGVNCLYNGMNVTKIENVCKELQDEVGDYLCEKKDWFDNIINITDKKSTINGKPYSFLFAVENRQPALDYISSSADPDGEYDYNIFVGSGRSKLKIEPFAYDPDEDYYDDVERNDKRYMDPDKVSYNYTGWKFDYDEELKSDCCNKYELDGVTVLPRNVGSGCQTNLDNCDCKKIDILKNCMQKVTATLPIVDLQGKDCCYSGSDLYEVTQDDMGYHEINISIKDEGGLGDNQTVRIIVTDKPKLVINDKSYFGFSGNREASIEDPFRLDASGSNTILNTGLSYKWELYDGGGNLISTLYEGYDALVVLPNTIDWSKDNEKVDLIKDNNIKTIKLFKTSDKGSKKIKLSVLDSSGNAIAKKWFVDKDDVNNADIITIYNCLPYSSDTAPYPYNNFATDFSYKAGSTTHYDGTETDPFLADHACCRVVGTDYKYKPGAECYKYISYGYYYDDTHTAFQDKFSSLELHSSYSLSSPSLSTGQDNDIWRREFKRKCSNDRGNICSGDMIETYSVVTPSCDDTNKGTGGTERCSGPEYFDEKSSIFGCKNYDPGTTFESLTERGTGNCAIGLIRMSSPGGTYNNKGSGKFKCINANCDVGQCKPINCKCESGYGADSSCDGKGVDEVCGGTVCDYTNRRYASTKLCSSSCDCKYEYGDQDGGDYCTNCGNHCGDGFVNCGEGCDDGGGNTNVACVPQYGGACTYCDKSCETQLIESTVIPDYFSQWLLLCDKWGGNAGHCGCDTDNRPCHNDISTPYKPNQGDQEQIDGNSRTWELLSLTENRYNNLDMVCDSTGIWNTLNYAFKQFDYSGSEKEVLLTAGANDGIKVWFNNILVINKAKVCSDNAYDKYSEEITLLPGENTIFVRIGSGPSTTAFQVGLIEIDGTKIHEIYFDN